MSMFLAGILPLCVLLGALPAGPSRSLISSGKAINWAQVSGEAKDSLFAQENGTSPSTTGSAPNAPPEAKQAPHPKATSAHKKKKPAAKPANAVDSGETPKKVVNQGGSSEPSVLLAPSVSNEESAKLKATTSGLRAEAQANLDKAALAGLKAEQQETAAQIRKFLNQSKDAEKDGDLPRASSLANKAKVLSEALLPKE